MSFDDLTPQQLRELLGARDAHIGIMVAHVADAEARLDGSPLVERLARDLFVMCGTPYVQLHDDQGQLPLERLQQIATDCWVSASIFARAPRARTALTSDGRIA